MANKVFYASYFSALYGSGINHLTGDIRVALFKNTYVFDGLSHLTLNQIISSEVVGAGYTTLGKALVNKLKVVNSAGQLVYYDADDLVWTNSTIGARYAVVYQYTGDPVTSPLMYLIDFGADLASSAGDFTVQWNVLGISSMVGL